LSKDCHTFETRRGERVPCATKLFGSLICISASAALTRHGCLAFRFDRREQH
jgi:hypothetical protein